MKVRRFLFFIFFILFFLIVILQLWSYFISLPVWNLQEIVVINNQYIPKEKVLEGITLNPNMSILKINKNMLKRNIYKISQIEKVIIRRQWPGTVVLDLNVKQPYLLFYIREHWWVVDKYGDILNRDQLSPQLPENICLIQGLASMGQIETTIKDIKKLVDAIYLYLGKEKVTIDYHDKNDLKIYLTDKVLVKIGEPQDLTLKIRNLAYVINAIHNKRNRVEYIDVRAYHTPAVKMR